VITTVVTSASPHYLLADAPASSVRPTRGGDAWAARQSAPDASRVLLGMPTVRPA
jgi:tRNA-2-methylthio-N6-dimethylallyladenosine synthase